MPFSNSSVALALVLFSFFLGGCNRSASGQAMDAELSGWIGERVRVQFRRDALGAAASLPIGPDTSSTNGAETALLGELLEVHPSSIVIESNGQQKWIPREVILSLQAPLQE